jgi:hypothetical protein
VLEGQADITKPSTISFYTATDQSYASQKQHLYDFVFFNISDYKVIEYRPIYGRTLPQDVEPTTKTVFIDVTHSRFFACSSTFDGSTVLQKPEFRPDTVCSEALGTYNENPYLFFTIETASPPSRTYIRSESKQYSFADDAPAVSLKYADASGNLNDTIVLRTALTKRNSHTTLKVCSDAKLVTADFLGRHHGCIK